MTLYPYPLLLRKLRQTLQQLHRASRHESRCNDWFDDLLMRREVGDEGAHLVDEEASGGEGREGRFDVGGDRKAVHRYFSDLASKTGGEEG